MNWYHINRLKYLMEIHITKSELSLFVGSLEPLAPPPSFCVAPCSLSHWFLLKNVCGCRHSGEWIPYTSYSLQRFHFQPWSQQCSSFPLTSLHIRTRVLTPGHSSIHTMWELQWVLYSPADDTTVAIEEDSEDLCHNQTFLELDSRWNTIVQLGEMIFVLFFKFDHVCKGVRQSHHCLHFMKDWKLWFVGLNMKSVSWSRPAMDVLVFGFC